MTAKHSSVKEAEKRAYAGENESQDSQLVIDKYGFEYGIGTMSSSPPRQQHPIDPKEVNSARPTGVEKSTKSPIDALRLETRPITSHSDAVDSDQRPCRATRRSTPRSSHILEHLSSKAQPQNSRNADVDTEPTPLTKDGVAPLPPVTRSTAPPKKTLKTKKMDGSIPDSPTQSNEGRSYEQYRSYYDPGIASSQPSKEQEQEQEQHGPSGLVDLESQVSRASSSHEHRTLHEDETGAVKFVWQGLDDDGHDDDIEGTRKTDPHYTTSQPAGKSQPNTGPDGTLDRQSMPAPTMPPPETPLVPSRIFQSDVPATDLMGASQLFMQTQFTSGAKKLASPTSSRPSPTIFNHNTISPNNESSPLKDRGLRTSPLQGLGTSPVCPVPATSSVPRARKQQEEEQELEQEIVLETIPGSLPDAVRPRLRTRPDPISDYAPIRNSPDVYNIPPDESQDQTDSDRDESQDLRRVARLRQEKANRSLTNITLPRQSSKDNVEVPSTNRRKHKAFTQSTTSAPSSIEVAKLRPRRGMTVGHDSQETVADSQEVTGTTTGTANPVDAPVENPGTDVVKDDTPSELPCAPQQSDETNGSKETIPETSPPGSLLQKRATQPAKVDTAKPRPLRSSGRINESSRPSSEETREVPSSPPMPAPVAASTQAHRRSSRQRPATTPIPVPTASPAIDKEPVTASSTLTVLTETPQVTSSYTPNTDTKDLQSSKNGSSSPALNKTMLSSPAAAKNNRQKPSKLKTYLSPRTRRHASVSTDELAFSTPNSALTGRTSRSFARKSINESRQSLSHAGLFQGMTFATSFQSEQEKKSVEKMIITGGGIIISKGFDELVEVGPLESNQVPSIRRGQSIGFAALITDTHSRKPKYMQALALGLPCLSWKWVSACVRAGEILDWSTYLLCAGQSQVLGAIRSRSLETYDAKSTDVERIIQRRSRLLSNSKILLVMKKTKREEEKRMQYVFLAQVLGASLVRVGTLEEARMELKRNEDVGTSFDWVYIDGHPVEAENILFGQGLPPPKKRKRQSTVDSADDLCPCPKRVRTLTDELVVQSLILGRMVEDGELNDPL